MTNATPSHLSIIALDRSLSRALGFLSAHQLEDGEFTAYVSPDPAMQKDCLPDSTPFVTALIVYSLGFLQDSTAQAMIAKANQFLLVEMEAHGVWRYWTSRNPQHHFIPPDLDDTSCAAFALKQNKISFPGRPELILANRNSNGLFYTWLLPQQNPPFNFAVGSAARQQAANDPRFDLFWQTTEAAPDDIDGVVNANVLLYLGECHETRPVIDYLVRILREHREAACDKWHLNRFSFYYMLSRAYYNGALGLRTMQETITERIRSAIISTGACGNLLETAMAVCTLLNFEYPRQDLQRTIAYLLEMQGENGAWPKIPMYWGGPKKVYSWGSEELTTAFCLEAMARYRSMC